MINYKRSDHPKKLFKSKIVRLQILINERFLNILYQINLAQINKCSYLVDLPPVLKSCNTKGRKLMITGSDSYLWNYFSELLIMRALKLLNRARGHCNET